MNVDIDDILNYPYWRHRIDLGDGNYTPGTKGTSDWERLKLPESLEGKSFLDIGAFDGLHSFEAERRGADTVLATDVWKEDGRDEWWYGREPREDSFDMVREFIGSRVENKIMGIEDISPDTVGEFDVTLCSKVIPFISNPLSAVENLVSVTRDRVVIESATPTLKLDSTEPVTEFAKATTGNPNRRWHPTAGALEKMLKHAGCRRTESYMVPNNVINVEEGMTSRESEVHRRYDLEEKVDDVDENTVVRILYEKDDAVRIEYRSDVSEPFRQGWTRQKDIESGGVKESSRLFRRALEVVREEGATALPPKALDYIKSQYSDSDNILLHGYVGE